MDNIIKAEPSEITIYSSVDINKKLIYLIDINGKIMNGFPLNGASMFSIGKLSDKSLILKNIF